MPRDYYIILGVSKNAELNKIKRAYREAVKRYHPDLAHPGEDTEKFMEIKEAYDTLGNGAKRKKYDEAPVPTRVSLPYHPSSFQNTEKTLSF